jgi:hypothetical protein
VTRTQAGKQALAAMASAARASTSTAAAITSIARTIGIAVAAVASNRFLLTAQQGDADDREKDRDSKQHSSIHPKLLEVSQSTVKGSEHVGAVTTLTPSA